MASNNTTKSSTAFLKKNTRFSAVFGGGLEYQMDKLKLLLDVRYDLGSDVQYRLVRTIRPTS